jgi:hypothetical protein
MNLNAKLDLSKFKLTPQTVLPMLVKARPYLIGISLIAVFGYTAYIVNAALNVTPAAGLPASVGVSFDKTTLNSLKNLTTVPTTIPPASLGKTDPFGNN